MLPLHHSRKFTFHQSFPSVFCTFPNCKRLQTFDLFAPDFTPKWGDVGVDSKSANRIPSRQRRAACPGVHARVVLAVFVLSVTEPRCHRDPALPRGMPGSTWRFSAATVPVEHSAAGLTPTACRMTAAGHGIPLASSSLIFQRGGSPDRSTEKSAAASQDSSSNSVRRGPDSHSPVR